MMIVMMQYVQCDERVYTSDIRGLVGRMEKMDGRQEGQKHCREMEPFTYSFSPSHARSGLVLVRNLSAHA